MGKGRGKDKEVAMTRQIWKFPLAGDVLQEIEMPKEAVILCVQTKDERLNLWAEVDVDAPKEKRVFEVFSTGMTMPTDMGVDRKYIGTFQTPSCLGTLVFHVYERFN